MDTVERGRTDPLRRILLYLRWPLLIVEIYILFVFCNTLFLVPAPYRGERGLIIAVSALLSAGLAFAGGWMFVIASGKGLPSFRKIFRTVPVVIYVVVLGLATLVFSVALLDSR